jgi:hypothetical protein
MSYVIIAYPKFESEDRKTIWQAKTKREVVGFMKTIMDNFNPAHVDVMSVEKYDQEFGKEPEG